MKTLTAKMIGGLTNFVAQIGKTLDQDTCVLIDKDGCWFSSNASEFFLRNKIAPEEFSNWLTLGAAHLNGFFYDGIKVHLVVLPGDVVLACLKDRENSPEGITLTKKEREVLSLVATGLSNKKIAALMNIAPGTVNSHLDKIYMKLHCSNRVSACFAAFKKGLLIPSDQKKELEHGQA